MKRAVRSAYQRIRFLIFGRPYVTAETTKAHKRREKEGFFNKYCQGKGLDIGYGGDPVVPGVKGWDWEHGDAQRLRRLKDETFDFVYSSHVIEHMTIPAVALKNWWRVLKRGGYLIVYGPHRDLYEKKKYLPSNWNQDHKHFYLLDRDESPDTKGIIPLIERVLPEGKIIYAKECSEGHTIIDPNRHSDGEYSFEVVVQKV